VGKRGYTDKERLMEYWVRLCRCISPCYGPFCLGARFETYEPFLTFIGPCIILL